MCRETNNLFVSISCNLNSPVLDRTMVFFEPSVASVVLMPSYSTLALKRETISDSVLDKEATPPTWKVRKVSCVPGSPMD